MCFMYHFGCFLSHAFNPSTKSLPWLGAPIARSMQIFLLAQKIESRWRAVAHQYFLAQPSVLSNMVSPSMSTFYFSIKHWSKTNMCACLVAAFCFGPSERCEWKCVFYFSFPYCLDRGRTRHCILRLNVTNNFQIFQTWFHYQIQTLIFPHSL